MQYRRDRLLSSAAEHVDVVAYERGQPGDVLVPDIEAVLAELGDGGVHVAGVEQHECVEGQAERADLVLSELAQFRDVSACEPKLTTESSREGVGRTCSAGRVGRVVPVRFAVLLGERVGPDGVEVQFVGPEAVGREGRDWSTAGAGSVEPLVACRSAAPVAVLPVGQWLKAGGVVGVQQHCLSAARRDEEASFPADHRSARLSRLRVLLIVLHDVGRSPGLGIDHVAASRNGGRCPACLLVPVTLVVEDVRDGSKLGQLPRDRGAALGTEEDGHPLVVVLRAAASGGSAHDPFVTDLLHRHRKTEHRRLQPLWERRVQGKRTALLSRPVGEGLTLADALPGARSPEALLNDTDIDDRIGTVLSQLPAAETEIALSWARTGDSWADTADGAGQEAAYGERVRRKLKRLGSEYARRQGERVVRGGEA